MCFEGGTAQSCGFWCWDELVFFAEHESVWCWWPCDWVLFACCGEMEVLWSCFFVIFSGEDFEWCWLPCDWVLFACGGERFLEVTWPCFFVIFAGEEFVRCWLPGEWALFVSAGNVMEGTWLSFFVLFAQEDFQWCWLPCAWAWKMFDVFCCFWSFCAWSRLWCEQGSEEGFV